MNNRNKTLTLLFCCTLLLGTSQTAVSAETNATPTTEETTPSSEKQEAAKTNQQKSPSAPNKTAKAKKDDEVFRPSEEISEDFAVSFPVDI